MQSICEGMKIDPHSSHAAPILNPHSYPGAWLPYSAVISTEEFFEATFEHLEEHSRGKVPLLAIGSNAAPSQLRQKFLGQEFSILNLVARASFSVGYAPFKSPYGAIPATAVFDGGESVVRCQFVEPRELEVLDATELPHYCRKTVVADVDFLGEVEAQVYVAVHDPLQDSFWAPLRLSPVHADGVMQAEVLRSHGEHLPKASYGIPFDFPVNSNPLGSR